MTANPNDNPIDDPLAQRGRSLASLFSVIFWGGALWLFAEAYVPLKQFGAALAGNDAAWQSSAQGLLRFLPQALPAIALLFAVETARRLFQSFGEGEILTAANGRALGHIGTALAVSAVLQLIAAAADGQQGGPLTSLVLVLGCVGFAIRCIGEAWERAAALQAELDAIV
jgi:hypothetical protein